MLPEKLEKKQNSRQRDIHPNPQKTRPEYPPKKPHTKSKPRKPRITGLQRIVLKFPKEPNYFILKKCSRFESVF